MDGHQPWFLTPEFVRGVRGVGTTTTLETRRARALRLEPTRNQALPGTKRRRNQTAKYSEGVCCVRWNKIRPDTGLIDEKK